MTEDGELKKRRVLAGPSPGATALAGNIMALVAYAMLFDDSEATGAATSDDDGDPQDPES
jgi:hypothetical protein